MSSQLTAGRATSPSQAVSQELRHAGTQALLIHGHFYQPPREHPGLEAVLRQDSASPYHDWNARISTECYTPNTEARLLDDHGATRRTLNNYAHISFNFGPTLLRWLEQHHPQVLGHLREADERSRALHNGHGNALAQAYNHLILPLASARDRRTQLLWGITDFIRRFGRQPEGLWCPETAVDIPTLEALADMGIQFTLLSPYQAVAVRAPGARRFENVAGGRIDPTRAYRLKLPRGKSIALFFYDGPTSSAVAFEGLLHDGKRLAERLAGCLPQRPEPALVHIATDGESYGHHHRFGEMALAYCIEHLTERMGYQLTSYGAWLAAHPPSWEVKLHRVSAWSCAHGIGRWSEDCGCRTKPGTHQRWRAPLRSALDFLRDRVTRRFAHDARALFPDPWAARDDYIQVLLDQTTRMQERFLRRHLHLWHLEGIQAERHSNPVYVDALRWMELMRHAMLMYTSCGWFFDDIDGIEGRQILLYADRVLQLGAELGLRGLERPFLRLLEAAESNNPAMGHGRRLFEAVIRPQRVGLLRAAQHLATACLSTGDTQSVPFYTFHFEPERLRRLEPENLRSVIGWGRVRSQITWEEARVLLSACTRPEQRLLTGARRLEPGENPWPLVNDVEEGLLSGRKSTLRQTFRRCFGRQVCDERGLLEGTFTQPPAPIRR